MRTRAQNFGVNSNIAMNTHAQAHPKFWSKFQPSYENIKLMNLSTRKRSYTFFFLNLFTEFKCILILENTGGGKSAARYSFDLSYTIP